MSAPRSIPDSPASPCRPLSADDWLNLAEAPGIGAMRWGALMRGEATPTQVDALLQTARTAASADRRRRLRARCDALGIRILTPADPRWPARLGQIPDPPACLFLRGDPACLERPQLAVVGARRATRRGCADAAWLVAELVRGGLMITSGLALGIDGAAHEAALAAGGSTVAVLGCGPDRTYPARHRALAGRIAASGALVSEFPPGTPPAPHHFPRRNRIISGLALGVLVVEAGERSGSMITARLAAEQGREVFAVPGTARDPNAAGCLRLLRDGACLVRSAADVLEELGLSPADPAPEAGPLAARAGEPLAAEAAALLEAIDPGGTDPDLVAARTGLSAAQLAALVSELELDGILARDSGRLVRLDR